MKQAWKVMIVDDEEDVHVLTKLCLEDFKYKDRPLEFLHAHTGEKAQQLIREHRDTALVLMDVVMETDDAGLKTVEYIRDDQRNQAVRIIMRTGQAGQAPERFVADNFDINEYRDKTEMTADKLYTSVRVALAAYDNIVELEDSRKKLMESAEIQSRLTRYSKRLAEIGIALSVEKNIDTLLELILEEALHISSADAGTLYIKGKNFLFFKIFQNHSLGIKKGGTTGDLVALPPVPCTKENVSAYVAMTGKTINIPDVYCAECFDFTGPQKYDSTTGYRSKSMLVMPMRNTREETIGVLQLLNAMDADTGEVMTFQEDYIKLGEALASQAAVSITNVMMEKESEQLFNSLVSVMATAVDEKSPYSGDHIQRVADMALALAKLVNLEKEGPLGDVIFNDDELYEIFIAGLMHDMGKVTIPERVMDKATKLENIFDRIHLIHERFMKIIYMLKSKGLKKQMSMRDRGLSREEAEKWGEEIDKKIMRMRDDLEFLKRCNSPGEFMESEKIERVRSIAART